MDRRRKKVVGNMWMMAAQDREKTNEEEDGKETVMGKARTKEHEYKTDKSCLNEKLPTEKEGH